MPEETLYRIKKRYQLLVKLVIGYLKRRYNIIGNVAPEVKGLKEPYLLLPNHYGRYDPFILSYFLMPYIKPPNFISSDAILRDKFYGRLFTNLGAVPKKKGTRDTQVIRTMLKIIEQGNPVALFAEGSRSWSGVNNYIDPSIAKLIRLLKVPVVTAKMKGASVFDPRWSERLRRSRLEIDYKLTLVKEELDSMSDEEIMDKILPDIAHDDIEYLKNNKVVIKSNRRAEYIEKIIFQCPDCNSYEGFDSYHNQFACNACGYRATVNKYGFFTSKYNKIYFNNTRDWLDWQNSNFVSYIFQKWQVKPPKSLFYATGLRFQKAIGYQPLEDLGKGAALFYHDRIVFKIDDTKIELLIDEIDSLSAQHQERVELNVGDTAYRFTSIDHKEPGLKWELAINAIWFQTDQKFKLSPYLKNLFQKNAGVDLSYLKNKWSTNMEF